MMLKSDSARGGKWRALAALPALMLGLGIVNIPFVANALNLLGSADFTNVSDCEVNDFPVNQEISALQATEASADAAMTSKSSENDAIEESIAENNTEAPENGEDKQAKEAAPLYYIDGAPYSGNLTEIDPGRIKSMSIRKDNPDGRVRIYIDLLKPGEKKPEAAKKDDGKEHMAAEKIASYPGGQAELIRFMQANIQYPKSEMNNPGKHNVIVRFIINEDGRVSDAQVLKGAGEAFDAEALRVVNAMPAWIPAENDGKPVATWFTLPVRFQTEPSEATPKQ